MAFLKSSRTDLSAETRQTIRTAFGAIRSAVELDFGIGNGGAASVGVGVRGGASVTGAAVLGGAADAGLPWTKPAGGTRSHYAQAVDALFQRMV
jgi:hypothetical protein